MDLDSDNEKASTSNRPDLEELDQGQQNKYKNEELPDCWTSAQFDDFSKKYNGLMVQHKKLGCKICADNSFINVKNLHVAKEWKTANVVPYGKTKQDQQKSLRKKNT